MISPCSSLAVPFGELNIFLLSMIKMLKRDLFVFIVLFAFFMLMFWMTLYILYPRSGSVFMPQVLPFNKWYNAIRSLIEVSGRRREAVHCPSLLLNDDRPATFSHELVA